MTKYDENSTTKNNKPFNTFRKSKIKRSTDAGKVATILKCEHIKDNIFFIISMTQILTLFLRIVYDVTMTSAT